MTLINFYHKKRLFLIGTIISIIIAYLDLLTKEIAFNAVEESFITQNLPYIKITNFFNIVKVWNTGVSFGMFNDLEYGALIFCAIVAVITVVLLVWLYKNDSPLVSYAISFIIGGALGNLIDRMNNGAVADFLDFHLYGYHWPAFNLADSAVFVGVAIILFDDLILKNNSDDKKNN